MKLEEIEALLDLAEMDPWHPEEAVRISNVDIRELVERVRKLENVADAVGLMGCTATNIDHLHNVIVRKDRYDELMAALISLGEKEST